MHVPCAFKSNDQFCVTNALVYVTKLMNKRQPVHPRISIMKCPFYWGNEAQCFRVSRVSLVNHTVPF